MKNRKKLAKGVIVLSMALSFGTAILAPTHEAVASSAQCGPLYGNASGTKYCCGNSNNDDCSAGACK